MKKILSKKELLKYIPGKKCKCYSSDSLNCSYRNADWTPKEVYESRLVLKNILASCKDAQKSLDDISEATISYIKEIAEEALK